MIMHRIVLMFRLPETDLLLSFLKSSLLYRV